MDASPRAPLAPPDSVLPAISQLREIVAKLRAPGGCPWDREQTHSTLRGAILEEAYEVVAAIDASDDANLQEELGDLLLQSVFHSQIAAEEGRFDFDDVARGIAEKLLRRHPHVFGAESAVDSAAVLKRWDEIKRAEKQPGGSTAAASLMDGVSAGMPALIHAEKIQRRAAKAGFDWSDAAPVFAKLREEMIEVEQAAAEQSKSRVEDEIGDLLFTVVNLARKLHIDAEVALRAATAKFGRRFRQVEQIAASRGIQMDAATLAELDAIWDMVKARDK